MRHTQKLEPTNVLSGRIAGKTGLEVYLLIHHLAVLDLEGIEFWLSVKQ